MLIMYHSIRLNSDENPVKTLYFLWKQLEVIKIKTVNIRSLLYCPSARRKVVRSCFALPQTTTYKLSEICRRNPNAVAARAHLLRANRY